MRRNATPRLLFLFFNFCFQKIKRAGEMNVVLPNPDQYFMENLINRTYYSEKIIIDDYLRIAYTHFYDVTNFSQMCGSIMPSVFSLNCIKLSNLNLKPFVLFFKSYQAGPFKPVVPSNIYVEPSVCPSPQTTTAPPAMATSAPQTIRDKIKNFFKQVFSWILGHK
jgi:hypothetical protein